MISIQVVEDSFAILRGVTAPAFDVVITDPPFDPHVHANLCSGTLLREAKAAGKGGGIPKVDLPFDPLQEYEWTKGLRLSARRWCVMFCSVEAFGDLRRIHGPAYRRGAFWYKPNAMGQLTADRPAVAGEGIALLHPEEELEGVACLHEGKPRWNGKGSFGFWPCNGTRGEKGRHPNQKPLDLCLKLVALFSDRGETIFDPFVGSGRIGEAAALLGRHYVGLEKDPAWAQTARDRIGSLAFGSVTDEAALALCSAKKSEIME